jgi:hypothetical protein
MNVMWTNTAFAMYIGQHEAITTAAFEPARRREVLLANLADALCAAASERTERTPARFGFGWLGLTARTAGRRFARG